MSDGTSYRGFIPDLLDAISEEEKTLAFDIQLVRDNQYGRQDPHVNKQYTLHCA